MSNPSANPSASEANPQAPPKKRYFNFLDQVIFRIEFTKEIDHSEKLVKDLHDRIKEIFPELKATISDIVEAKIQPPLQPGEEVTQAQRTLAIPKVTQTQRRLLLPSFSDFTLRKQLYFEPSALVVRQGMYTTFDEFYEMITTGIEGFEQVYGHDITVKRAELRYINVVKLVGDPLDWKGYIKSELLSLLNFPREKGEISRAMNLLELTRKGYNVRFQSGLWNRDYPNPTAKREFILDYACYSTEESEIKSITELARKFHTEIELLFNDSILKNLKTRLGA